MPAKDGWKLFKELKANGAIIAGANADALNPVLQGAKAAVFGAVDYISLAAKAKGESIDVIFPASGTVIAPRPAMIMKWSKNQDEAKKFIDYMLSDEGQKAVADQTADAGTHRHPGQPPADQRSEASEIRHQEGLRASARKRWPPLPRPSNRSVGQVGMAA